MTEPPLSPDLLKIAYSQGVFPMAEDGRVLWYRPSRRGLLPIEGIRVSRSLQKLLSKEVFEVTFDSAFEEVIRGCMDRESTWITEEFVNAYTGCHREGWGHSCEVWTQGQLAGGVYGLAVGGVFCGESMFSRERDASKVALWALVQRCQTLGFKLFDCQILNPHTESLGGFEIPNEDYLEMLRKLLLHQTPWSWNP